MTRSTKRTGPSRRTQAQRDAINRRAAAWKRPKRKCKRSGCDRPAFRGWTHCKRHYSAGRRFAKAEA
jgi:hypothetical protein